MRTPDLSRAVWRTSKRSQQNGACVEVAPLDASVGVRDSKAPDADQLILTRQAWTAFLTHARAGLYDQ